MRVKDDERILKFVPSVLIKGDYVGHPFRGNQWTDASGVSRGRASGSATGGDQVDLRGVATVEEARRTRRPLALLQPESFSAGVKSALQAHFQATEIIKNLLEGVPYDEQGKVADDPRFIVADFATKILFYEIYKQVGADYALALGFEEVSGEEAEKARFEKYPFESLSRNEDGRLIREEEFAYPTEMTGEQYAINAGIGPTVWRDASGKLHTWINGEEPPAAFLELHGAASSSDRIDLKALADPSRISQDSTWTRDTESEGIQRGPQAATFAKQELEKRVRSYGINLPDIKPFARLSAKSLIEKLRADGDPDPQGSVGRLIEHVNEVAKKIAFSHASSEPPQRFKGHNIDGTEDSQMARQIEDVTPDAKISVTVPAQKIGAILREGRLKTQFETGRSGGANMPTWRENWEAVMFGYPIGSDPSVRPIYGMVETGGVKPSSLRGNEQYGTVTLVLKDSVRDRTTFTNGDSLNLNPFHVPVNNPSQSSASRFPTSASFEAEIKQKRAADPSERGYYEAQIHGGVSVSDIERVVIDTSTYKDFEQREVQPSAALLKALGKAGIPYEIVQGKPPTATKSAFAPSMLIKGDYVGHPFRGNQWMDASGVSRREAGSSLATEPTVAGSGFINGLPAPTADPVIAAREGRPLAGWLHVPPEAQALIDRRDALLDERSKMIPEAKRIRDEYLKSLTPEQAAEEENRRLARTTDGRSLLLFASENNPDFAARLKAFDVPEELGYYKLQKPLLDAALVAAGFRYRTEEEMAQLESDLNSYYKFGSPEYLAQQARLKADPPVLEYASYSRGRTVDGRTGRLEVQNQTERVWASSRSVGIPDQLLGRLSFGPLLARGLTTQQIGELLMAAKSVANNWLETPAVRASFNDQTVAQMNAEIEKALPRLDEAVKNAQVSVTVPPRVLASILKDGKFETQFVSGKSGGYNLPQARQGEEASRFGYPADLNPELRPVYGMIEETEIRTPHDRGNLQYGNALVILKPEVRERTTFSNGDSLSLHAPSTPLTNPRAQPLAISRNLKDGSKFELNYPEAQIHGGVRVSDIARVVFQVSSVGAGGSDIAPDPKLVKPPSPSLLKALDKAGIPYQIVRFTSEIEQPVSKHRRWLAAFEPSVLIKGDYLGHPFRGNQWVDASGVSTKPAGTASDHQGGFAAGKKYERQRGPFRADPISQEPLRDVSSPTGEYDARSAGDMGRQYETSSKPKDESRILSDQKARGIAADLMNKMDIVAVANATIKIGSPSRESRAVYNDQLDSLAEAELKTRTSQRLLDGILSTQEALNDEGTIVVITDEKDRVAGALSLDGKPTDSSAFSEKSSFHPMSEVVKPNEKYIQMRSAGSLGRIDGVGSTLFGQAVLAASREKAGLYLTPLNKSAQEFWESVGFKTVDAGPEFTRYQYLDAGSVKAIADNLDDPMEQQ